MERVERHLRSWFTHRLSTNRAHHFAGIDDRRPEDFTQIRNELIETVGVEAVFTHYLLGIQVSPQENLE